MAITLPIGIRIAAGLLGSTIDRIGRLPQELPTLGVSLAGQAVRTSFRIRQEIAELATRGDELLSGITGRPEEKPEWATFDEDEDEDDREEDAPENPAPTGPAKSAYPAAQSPAAQSPAAQSPAAKSSAARKSPQAPTRSQPKSPPRSAPRSAASNSRSAAAPITVPVPTNRIRPGRATPVEGAPPAVAAPRAARLTPGRKNPVAADPAGAAPPIVAPKPLVVPGAAVGTVAAGSPSTVMGDHLLSIAELKEELQDMGAAEVRELLALEETGPNRAAYLTLLSNRLTTLAHENGQSDTR